MSSTLIAEMNKYSIDFTRNCNSRHYCSHKLEREENIFILLMSHVQNIIVNESLTLAGLHFANMLIHNTQYRMNSQVLGRNLQHTSVCPSQREVSLASREEMSAENEDLPLDKKLY